MHFSFHILTADHFDFCLPFEENSYTVLENYTTLEVCVKLVSTNSCDNTLTSPVLILPTITDISATGTT